MPWVGMSLAVVIEMASYALSKTRLHASTNTDALNWAYSATESKNTWQRRSISLSGQKSFLYSPEHTLVELLIVGNGKSWSVEHNFSSDCLFLTFLTALCCSTLYRTVVWKFRRWGHSQDSLNPIVVCRWGAAVSPDLSGSNGANLGLQKVQILTDVELANEICGNCRKNTSNT